MTERFEILEGIARGGMAEVYRAEVVDPEGRAQQVCIKKILPHLVDDQQSLDMFIGEAQLAATLTCPQIVQVFDLCVSHDNEYFIVMEYVDGLDLARLMLQARKRHQPMPLDLVIRVAVELCRGLQYAHARTDPLGSALRIVHRDISPQNVLVSKEGDVKITDFGIAKSSLRMATTAIGVLKGKYGYMSPEQANGQPLDHRSDLFNVGILLYELLTGERCFAGASDFSTLRLMRHAEVLPPRQVKQDLDPALEAIVLKALAREPAHRFQSAQELVNALLLCPAAKLGRREDLARYVGGLAERSEDGTREKTGVLTLSSVVHRDGRAEPSAPGADPTAPLAPTAPSAPRVPSRAWAWALSGAILGAGATGLLRCPPSVDRQVRQARTPSAGDDAETAVISFESDPPGARVFLDGLELAGKTPVVVERRRDRRPHRVRFEHPEQATPQELSFQFEPTPLTRVRHRFAPTASTEPAAWISVHSFPEGQVWVDDQMVGRSDGAPIRVSPGRRTVRVETADARTGRPLVLDLAEGSRKQVVYGFDE